MEGHSSRTLGVRSACLRAAWMVAMGTDFVSFDGRPGVRWSAAG